MEEENKEFLCGIVNIIKNDSEVIADCKNSVEKFNELNVNSAIATGKELLVNTKILNKSLELTCEVVGDLKIQNEKQKDIINNYKEKFGEIEHEKIIALTKDVDYLSIDKKKIFLELALEQLNKSKKHKI